MQEDKVAVWGDITNSWGKMTSQKQGRKGKIYPTECRVSENSKKWWEGLLNEQYKEIEKSNRMGKTRDLFKKIRDNKGTFHARMGIIRNRNIKDLIGKRDSEEVTRIHRRTVKKKKKSWWPG